MQPKVKPCAKTKGCWYEDGHDVVCVSGIRDGLLKVTVGALKRAHRFVKGAVRSGRDGGK